MEEEPLFNEEDIAHTSEVPLKNSKPVKTITIKKVYTPPVSFV